MQELILPYPLSTNRYWKSAYNPSLRRTIVYVSNEANEYKKQVKAIAKGIKPSSRDFSLEITLHPKQNKDGKQSKVCVDLDNVLKVTLDALNGVLWHDDKQVVRILLAKGESRPNGGLTVNFNEI